MKPGREVIPPKAKQSFVYNVVHLVPGPHQKTWFHYHPEHEIVQVVDGGGAHYVGDAVGYHTTGDLLLLAANLPHTFDATARLCAAHGYARYRVVQFAHDFMGEGFFDRPELARIADLLQRASKGILIKGAPDAHIARGLRALNRKQGLDRVFGLLRCLEDIAASAEGRLLCSVGYQPGLTEKDTHLIGEICSFIMENHTGEIRLPDIAARFHMAPTTFARFFRRHTGKTLIEFVNTVRVNQACQLLTATDMSISEIGYTVGFNGMSYFDRKFHTLHGVSPKEYRRSAWEK